MTMMSEAELADFVTASATMLGLPLDEDGFEAVRDIVRSMQAQVALVLDYVPAEASR